jgi:hypothetical protein
MQEYIRVKEKYKQGTKTYKTNTKPRGVLNE